MWSCVCLDCSDGEPGQIIGDGRGRNAAIIGWNHEVLHWLEDREHVIRVKNMIRAQGAGWPLSLMNDERDPIGHWHVPDEPAGEIPPGRYARVDHHAHARVEQDHHFEPISAGFAAPSPLCKRCRQFAVAGCGGMCADCFGDEIDALVTVVLPAVAKRITFDVNYTHEPPCDLAHTLPVCGPDCHLHDMAE